MRSPLLVVALSVPLLAQSPPNCLGIGRDVDVRCACEKDPGSKLCEMVKAGFYDSNGPGKTKPITLNWAGVSTQPGIRPAAPQVQPVRPQQARVVPLPSRDYLRFIQPNAHVVAGMNFEKAFASYELMEGLFGKAETQDARNEVINALKEMDHLWLSFAAPSDLTILMTGRFQTGAAARMFYAKGIRPVFLGGSGAMMIGSEPSIEAALARLAKPAPTQGWVARHARELSQDHEVWVVNERPPGTSHGAGGLQLVRRFALGLRLAGEGQVDGEAEADSAADAQAVAGWVDQMKVSIREKTGAGALDSLNVEQNSSTLKFAAKGGALLTGEAGKAAMSSDLGVELYSVIMAGFPGMPPTTVALDKLLTVQAGMKREDVLSLLGRPLSISSIQGLEIPRETWTYQVPFGKRFALRLDGGVVAAPPR